MIHGLRLKKVNVARVVCVLCKVGVPLEEHTVPVEELKATDRQCSIGDCVKKLLFVAALVALTASALVITVFWGWTSRSSATQEPTLQPFPSPTPCPTATPMNPPEPESYTTDFTNPTSQFPLGIRIIAPQNKSCQTGNLTLEVDVGSRGCWAIESVYYRADWLEGYHLVFSPAIGSSLRICTSIRICVNFTEVPDGAHTITVYESIHDGGHFGGSISFSVKSQPAAERAAGLSNVS